MSNFAPNDKILVLDQVSRRFGDLEVLRDVNLTLRRGESLALLGPSGSGNPHFSTLRDYWKKLPAARS